MMQQYEVIKPAQQFVYKQKSNHAMLTGFKAYWLIYLWQKKGYCDCC